MDIENDKKNSTNRYKELELVETNIQKSPKKQNILSVFYSYDCNKSLF